ncbi:DUF6888 family protein [Leptolyngbya sp. NIES-2104]|uniref:DUF6888 family protein n=1 Tax=Leptolyngbya sp. NIES-2104 TaxID=1552121 RepID=UPI00073E6141|nr:hypothetical protein [Leptolyngbya sp. NIES-2104]
MSSSIYPTPRQEAKCILLCMSLTRMYVPIHLVRLDERNRNIILLAGEEIEIYISEDGEWGYIE